MGKTEKKNRTAKNNKFSYKYVDIAQIHDYLDDIGMRYYQYIERIDGDDYIVTVPIDENGNELKPLRGARVVQATLQGTNNPAQEQGSALTYARRYSLLMAFGLATEDDDAQTLSRPIEPYQPAQKPQQTKAAERITPDQVKKLEALISSVEAEDPVEIRIEKMCHYYGVHNFSELTPDKYSKMYKQLGGKE